MTGSSLIQPISIARSFSAAESRTLRVVEMVDFMTRRKYLYFFILFLTACGGGDGGSNLGSQQNAALEFIDLTEYVKPINS